MKILVSLRDSTYLKYNFSCFQHYLWQLFFENKECFFFFFPKDFFFQNSFRLTAKLEIQIFFIQPCPHTYTSSLIINIPHQNDIFAITDEPTLAYHYHSESIGYIRVYCWCCTFFGFGQIYNDIIHHCSIIQSIFTAPKSFLLLLFISLCPLTPGNHRSLC